MRQRGFFFDWKGTGKDSSDTTIDFNEDLHGILDRTRILENLISQSNNRFEIDSKCPDSDMVNKVKKEIERQDNSLLKHGTWLILEVHRILRADICFGHLLIRRRWAERKYQ